MFLSYCLLLILIQSVLTCQWPMLCMLKNYFCACCRIFFSPANGHLTRPNIKSEHNNRNYIVHLFTSLYQLHNYCIPPRCNTFLIGQELHEIRGHLYSSSTRPGTSKSCVFDYNHNWIVYLCSCKYVTIYVTVSAKTLHAAYGPKTKTITHCLLGHYSEKQCS